MIDVDEYIELSRQRDDDYYMAQNAEAKASKY